jgi:N-formylglutamate deformylase
MKVFSKEEIQNDTDRIYPPWVVLHVPHDSTEIPSAIREQFLLNDKQLVAEIGMMTDHLTLSLFVDPQSDAQVIRAPVSRLVVDVERFPCDNTEPMAARGMGVVYTATSQLLPLRRPLGTEERDALIQTYYFPHHSRLEAAVTTAIQRDGRCLVIDCHSFPGKALHYEFANPRTERPDICIGTDAFHTTDNLASAFVEAFQNAGWSVQLNKPFAGAMVPGSRYRQDKRVHAIMVEINRRLYLRGQNSERLLEFNATTQQIRRCCVAAIERDSEREA